MSVTPAPHNEFHRPHLMGQATPIVAVALVLVCVAFTSWFWLTENDNLLDLVPLYLPAAFFCVDMIFLRKRLRKNSKDLY